MRALPRSRLELAEQHLSLLTRDELALPDVTIHRLVRGGLIVRVGRSQYRVGGAAAHPLERLTVAVARAGEDARVAGPWALGLRQIEGFDLSEDRQIAIPPQRRVTGVDFTVVRSPLPEEDHAEVLGLPTVTVERALIDAARWKSRRTIRVAYYDAKYAGVVRPAILVARAEALGRVPGAAQMRAIIASGALGLDSEGERNLLEVFQPGDPLPEPQVRVAWEDRTYRLDFAYLDARLALEYDSRLTHEDRFHDDRDRDLALAELKIQTLRITKEMLRSPLDTRRRILAIRAQRLELGLPPIVPLRR